MNAREDAERIEQLLPRALSALFPPCEKDPLKHHSVGQIRLMRCLLERARTAGELSQILGLSPSSLTQMAARMISVGLVEKDPSPKDRRVRTLSLTAAGELLMERRQAARADSAVRILAQLRPDQRRQLIELLEEISCHRKEPLLALA